MPDKIPPINFANGLDQEAVIQILQEFTDKKQGQIPELENVLFSKKDAINNQILESAQERNAAREANFKRLAQREEKTERVKERVKYREDLAEEQIARRQIERLQKKAQEEETNRIQNLQEKREERKIVDERAREQDRLNREEEAELLAERNEKFRAQREAEPQPEEIGAEKRQLKKEITEKAREVTAENREALREQREELQTERREGFQDFLEELRKRVELVDQIEEEAQERTEEKKELDKEPELFRQERRSAFAALEEKRRQNFEEKMQPTLRHFEKLEARMEELFEASQRHREEARQTLKQIISDARKRRDAAMLAAGNPLMLRQALGDIDFFKIIRERVHKIMQSSDAFREEWVQIKADITERGRERSFRNMLASGHPKALIEEFGDFYFYLLRKDREIFSIIKNARDRSMYNDMLSGMPNEKRKKIHRTLYRILSILHDPKLFSSDISQDIIRLARRKPDFIILALVEKVIRLQASRRALRMAEHILETKTPEINEISMVLRQENLKSFFSSMLIDRSINAHELLHNNFMADKKGKHFSFIDKLIRSFTQKRLQQPSIPDQIYIELDESSRFYNPLEKEIEIGLHTNMPSLEELSFQDTEDTSRKRQHERLAAEEHKQQEEQEEKRKAALIERRKQYIKLIEEQNMTAQEKLNHERSLIDFFF